MIKKTIIFSTALVFMVVLVMGVLPLLAQSPQQLGQLVEQLRVKPDDNALREQIIKLASAMQPRPAVPENARQNFVEGAAIKQTAKDTSGQKLAIASFEKALQIAPW